VPQLCLGTKKDLPSHKNWIVLCNAVAYAFNLISVKEFGFFNHRYS